MNIRHLLKVRTTTKPYPDFNFRHRFSLLVPHKVEKPISSTKFWNTIVSCTKSKRVFAFLVLQSMARLLRSTIQMLYKCYIHTRLLRSTIQILYKCYIHTMFITSVWNVLSKPSLHEWKSNLQANTVQRQLLRLQGNYKPSPGPMQVFLSGKNTLWEHRRSVKFPKDISSSKCTTHSLMKGISLSVEVCQ